jgi:hypothetical protein
VPTFELSEKVATRAGSVDKSRTFAFSVTASSG